MPSENAANRSELERWSARLRRQAKPAVRAGQAVIADGLRRRCPKDAPGLAASIEARAVGDNREFVGGFIVVNHPGTRRAERRRPFILPTFEQDGPRAVRAMMDVLKRG